jgi:hypothetical protein
MICGRSSRSSASTSIKGPSVGASFVLTITCRSRAEYRRQVVVVPDFTAAGIRRPFGPPEVAPAWADHWSAR